MDRFNGGGTGKSSSGDVCFQKAPLSTLLTFEGMVKDSTSAPKALRTHFRWDEQVPAYQEAVVDMQYHLPFPLKGIDSDNGREFINTTLLQYCRANGITFTRGRPYRKNDIAVRQVVGYYCFTTDAEYQACRRYTPACFHC